MGCMMFYVRRGVGYYGCEVSFKEPDIIQVWVHLLILVPDGSLPYGGRAHLSGLVLHRLLGLASGLCRELCLFPFASSGSGTAGHLLKGSREKIISSYTFPLRGGPRGQQIGET